VTGNHDKRGRFAKGNQAGKRRRPYSKQMTTGQLIAKTDKVLAGIGQKETAEQMGAVVAKLISQARTGNTTAATWLLDRVAPRERIRLSRPLPSPTADPLTFIDDLANRISEGELTVDQASKLSNLAKPLLGDAELQHLRKQVDQLLTVVDRIERTRLQAVDR